MKILNSFRPFGQTDPIGITASTNTGNFPASNLKHIDPVKCWKSSDTIGTHYVIYDFGTVSKHGNFVFLNRFNFSEFELQSSTDNVTFSTVAAFENLQCDEIQDEFYMHIKIEIDVEFRYLKVLIPPNVPVFQPSYYKIGNFLVGNAVDMWPPKGGFAVSLVTKEDSLEFTSGHMSSTKTGRTRRHFSGSLDKIKLEEYLKFINSREPFVFSLEFDSDNTSVYLVKYNPSHNQTRTYNYGKIVTVDFQFVEIV